MFRSSRLKTKAGASGRLVPLALALALVACSGGDESSSPPTPCTNIDFAASNQSPSSGDVFIQSLPSIYSTCTTIDIQVIVNDLTDIWTVGFDLTFPDSLVRYESYTLGPLLQQGNFVNTALVRESSGTLEFTATQLRGDPAVDAVGSQVLIVFRFSKLTAGVSSIDFDLSGGSTVGDEIQNASGTFLQTDFGPGHGGLLTVPM